MAYLALACGLLLPWVLGFALLCALNWPGQSVPPAPRSAGGIALRLGVGYFVGALLLTLWMRGLSAAGVGFGRLSIGAPLLVGAFALLAAEVAWHPLYPWDAWVQWATKARVWYELGRIVPFAHADAWLAGPPGAYFDAAPNDP